MTKNDRATLKMEINVKKYLRISRKLKVYKNVCDWQEITGKQKMFKKNFKGAVNIYRKTGPGFWKYFSLKKSWPCTHRWPKKVMTPSWGPKKSHVPSPNRAKKVMILPQKSNDPVNFQVKKVMAPLPDLAEKSHDPVSNFPAPSFCKYWLPPNCSWITKKDS